MGEERQDEERTLADEPAEEGSAEQGDTETPEEFARDMESDPSRAPSDPSIERLRGG